MSVLKIIITSQPIFAEIGILIPPLIILNTTYKNREAFPPGVSKR
jgi:hypothetical protein